MPIVKRIIANDTVYELMGSGGEGSSDNKIVFTAITNTSSSNSTQRAAVIPSITNVTLVKGNIQVLYEEIKAKEPICGELIVTRETVNEYAPEIYYYNCSLSGAFYTIDGNEIIDLCFINYSFPITAYINLSSNDGFNTYTITASSDPYTLSYDSESGDIE